MNFTTEITVGGKQVIINVPRGTKAWRKANSIFVPFGPSYSQAWLILTKGQLDDLDENGTHSIVWKMISKATGESPPVTSTLTFQGWRLLEAERLLTGGPDDANALYLAQFVDVRYLCMKSSATDAIRANLRSYAHDADYLTETTTYGTWENLVSKLWTDCALLGSYPGLPGGLPIDGVPEGTWLIGLNGWKALCAVLDQLDCGVAHDPFANSYTIKQLGGVQDIAENAGSLQWDAQPVTSNVAYAATCRVHFFYNRKSYGQERDTELATNYVVQGASDVIDVASGIDGATGVKFLWDDQPWMLDETETHTNAAANTARAANRAARYATRCTVTAVHKVFSGLLSDYLPGGQIRAVIWRNFDDGAENPLGATVTEFVAGPELAVDYRDGYVWFDKEIVTPENEQYGPPDYGRHTTPSYPRLPNIVQIYNDQFDPGAIVQPNADGFHIGKVKRWVKNNMESPDDPNFCWILFVDDYDNNLGQVSGKNRDYYGPARLSGVTTSDGQRLPVYLVRSTERPLVFFELRDYQYLGLPRGKEAEILEWDGADWSPSGVMIMVDDWYRGALDAADPPTGFFTGANDVDRGWAKYYQAASGEVGDTLDHYIVIWMSGPCHVVEFELNISRGGGGVSQQLPGTVLKAYLYGHEFYAPVGDTVNLRFPAKYFPLAKQGAKGTAVYDDESAATREYRVIQCDQLCVTAHAALTTDMCNAESTYFGAGFTAASEWPLNQKPAIDITGGGVPIINFFNHKGMAGDIVELNLWEDIEEYIIVDVEKHDIAVGGKVFDDGLNLVQDVWIIAAEWCTDPVENIILGERCASGSGS